VSEDVPSGVPPLFLIIPLKPRRQPSMYRPWVTVTFNCNLNGHGSSTRSSQKIHHRLALCWPEVSSKDTQPAEVCTDRREVY
jgi:hypothetical protein